MHRIKAHRPDGGLNELNDFLPIVDEHFAVDEWHVEVWTCVGDGALAFEKQTAGGQLLSNQVFRQRYAGIAQTIDGRFELRSNGRPVACLDMVDSSWWEVTSESQPFVAAMVTQFGVYEDPA